MLETYQGILRENRIEWSGDAPKPLSSEQVMKVHVTVLESLPAEGPEQGRRMAAALERLAALSKLESIPDPAQWEREIRQDRPLPGRDD